MTSSLPNFAPAPAPAGSAPQNAASTLAGFGTVSTTSSSPGDFADLMSEQGVDADVAAVCPDTATATPTFTILAPTLISLLAAPAAEASADVAALPETAATGEAAPGATLGGITRDMMEQAASLLSTILQSLMPAATTAAPLAAGTDATVANPTAAAATPGHAAEGKAGLANVLTGKPATKPGNAVLPETVASSEGAANPAEEAAAPGKSATAGAASYHGTTVNLPPTAKAPAVVPTAVAAKFEVSLAADGAVEVKAELPEEQGSDVTATTSSTGAFEFEAEVALPGQAVMRLSAGTPSADEFAAKAKFAGKIAGARGEGDSEKGAAEINFLSTAEEELTIESQEAGITVAKTDATMNTPTQETRATSNFTNGAEHSARGQFTVAWPSAERTGDTGAVQVEKNFAERAVATVANLVDTQFNASMQKSGSVQLRLKFGGEDLSVRVELRGGAVHTDFRTDSPELRAALNREWQVVANQSSDSLRRFIEPVFSPSSSSEDPYSPPRQQSAQQDLSQQSRNPRSRDEEAGSNPFARRSLVGEIFSPQPVAAPRSPAFVSTSLRLSVLA